VLCVSLRYVKPLLRNARLIDFLRIFQPFTSEDECRIAIDTDGHVLSRYHCLDDPEGIFGAWFNYAGKLADVTFKRVPIGPEVPKGKELFVKVAELGGGKKYLFARHGNDYKHLSEKIKVAKIRVCTGDKILERIQECRRAHKSGSQKSSMSEKVAGKHVVVNVPVVVAEEVDMSNKRDELKISGSSNVQAVVGSKNGRQEQTVKSKEKEELLGKLNALKAELADDVKGAVIETLKAEIEKPKPDKGVLSRLWNFVKDGISTAGTVAEIGSKIGELVG